MDERAEQVALMLTDARAETLRLFDLARESDLHESPGFGYRPTIWLFPNRAKNGPLSRAEAWHIFPRRRKEQGLKRAVVFTAFVRASPRIFWRQVWTCARSSF